MRCAADQLEQHLAGGLRSAYLIAGDEPLLLQEAADAVRRAARKQGIAERQVLDVGPTTDWQAWTLETRSFGLFAQRRLLELRLSTPKLNAEGAEALIEFLGDPGADVLLVQVPEWGKAVESLPWVAALDRAGVLVPIWPLKTQELPAWLSRRARKLGVRLTDDASVELMARVEGNLLAAQQELAKLALLVDGREIDAAALVDLVADHARFDVYALFDAVLARRPDRARRILRALRGEGFAPAELSGYLISQISALAAADAVRDSGGNLQAHWASARVYGQRQAQMERALGRDWGVRLAEALEIDLACKGRSPVEPWVALERWLLRAALPPARAARFAA